MLRPSPLRRALTPGPPFAATFAATLAATFPMPPPSPPPSLTLSSFVGVGRWRFGRCVGGRCRWCSFVGGSRRLSMVVLVEIVVALIVAECDVDLVLLRQCRVVVVGLAVALSLPVVVALPW